MSMSQASFYSAITIDTVPETDVPHMRFTSGTFVYDEVFAHGRLLGRWWASDGGIRPEMHFRWSNWLDDIAPGLPADAFSLALDGETLQGGWRWLGAEETPDPSSFRGENRTISHVVVRLKHERRPVEVAVHTRLDGGPFILRWLEITSAR